jgi:hypothetical protein
MTSIIGRFQITQDLDFSDFRRYTPGTHAGLLRKGHEDELASLLRVLSSFTIVTNGSPRKDSDLTFSKSLAIDRRVREQPDPCTRVVTVSTQIVVQLDGKTPPRLS